MGIEDFLLAPAGGERDHAFTGRSHWVSLLGEILPRALLAELGLRFQPVEGLLAALRTS